jgi:cytochrome c-type biogenesis protein CcmF
MSEFGHFCTCLAWLLSLVGMAASYKGFSSTQWLRTALVSNGLCFLSLLLAFSALGYCFVTDDYSVQYVWQYSNRTMPSIYKFSAIWGGMDGSMLLWCLILSVSGVVLSLNLRNKPGRLAAGTTLTFLSSLFFFLTVTLFLTNPFRYIKVPVIPLNGQGLNPLLQNPYMAIHPPMLYLGFTTFAIPYAYCMGMLLSGATASSAWVRYSRTWTLVAWAFLTTGIVLGGHWAYLELGWGGFWAWDPVENASFLPWLTGTAFLHSVMIEERKGMLKVWNVSLVTITYALTVFGTFLTRSGIVQSVHSFAETDIGWVFLTYLALVLIFAIVLVWRRSSELQPDRAIRSFFSREVAFLVNNLILVSICFAVFWGVMFPVFSEALLGEKQTIGIPFFNKVTLPFFLLLLVMMGVGPLVGWRKGNVAKLWEMIRLPLASGLLVSLFFLFGGVRSMYATMSYGICSAVLFIIMAEFHRGAKSQKNTSVPKSYWMLLRKHPSRYGGYVVHLGVLFACIGITASMAHKTEKEFSLFSGESVEIGRFALKLDGVSTDQMRDYDVLKASIGLSDRFTGRAIGNLAPELRFYRARQESTTEVALRMGLREDVYVVLAGVDDSGSRASLKVYINPLQVWLWFGAIIMIVGTVFAVLPRFRASQGD